MLFSENHEYIILSTFRRTILIEKCECLEFTNVEGKEVALMDEDENRKIDFNLPTVSEETTDTIRNA